MASSELLKQIQSGKKLKPTETSDRSAPKIDNSGGSKGRGGPPSSAPSMGGGSGGPPQLGNLFASGMPQLRPAAGKLGTIVHLHC